MMNSIFSKSRFLDDINQITFRSVSKKINMAKTWFPLIVII